MLDAFPVQFGYVHARKFGFNHEAVADGFHLRRYTVLFQQVDSHGHDDDGNERTRNLVGQFGGEGDNGHADYTHGGGPYVQAAEVADVHDPFLYEIGRHVVDGQSEQVFDLRRENGHGDSAGEAYHDGIGDVFDDGTQMEYAQQNQEHAGHDGGHKQACFAVLLYDTVDDNDKSPRRSADLHTASAKQGHGQSGDDGRDDALLRCHAGCNAEGYGQWQGYDAHYEAGHDVCRQLFFVVLSQVKE